MKNHNRFEKKFHQNKPTAMRPEVITVVNALIDLNPDESRDKYELLRVARPNELADALRMLGNMRRLFGGKGAR